MRIRWLGLPAFFCLLLRLTAAEPVAYGDNPAAGKFYDINGFRMYCEIYGEGRPLLLIHGNGGKIAVFAANIPFFAEKYRVIVPDCRGRGKSKDPGDRLTYEMLADDLAELLTQLHAEPVLVVGLSDGGINGLLLTLRHPEKVAKLAVSGANLRPEAAAFVPGFWERMQGEYKSGKDQSRTTEDEKNAWKLFMLEYTGPHIALGALQAISCPALIICGDRDVIALEHTVQIFRNIPKAALWVMPQTGHLTARERPVEFDRGVDEFFSQPSGNKK